MAFKLRRVSPGVTLLGIASEYELELRYNLPCFAGKPARAVASVRFPGGVLPFLGALWSLLRIRKHLRRMSRAVGAEATAEAIATLKGAVRTTKDRRKP